MMGLQKPNFILGWTRTNLGQNLAKFWVNPARIAILHLLSEKINAFNGTLVDEIGLAQAHLFPNISKH